MKKIFWENFCMNGLYFTVQYNPRYEVQSASRMGVEKKIKKQIEIFEENGYQITVVNPNSNATFFDKIARRLPIKYETFKYDPMLVKKCQFLYVRKPRLIDYRLIDYLKNIKNCNKDIKILMEIPTFPYDNEIKGIKNTSYKIKDKISRNKLKKYVDCILTYSKDQVIFGIPTINLVNGIDYNEINKYELEQEDDGKIHVIACACLGFYHGYDRAIKGLHLYLNKQNSIKNIVLDIVGDGEKQVKEQYEKLVKKYQLEEHVILHGKLLGEDLARVYNRAVIGLDSMGRHRSGVYYNSSLKGKEYCAYGLTIVSGVETELDNDSSFQYYYRIPADETPMDWEGVLQFYFDKTQNGQDSERIKESIKKYALENYDMRVVFKPVIDYIKQPNNLSI